MSKTVRLAQPTAVTTIIPYWGVRDVALWHVLDSATWDTLVVVPSGISIHSSDNPHVRVVEVDGIDGWPISDLLNVGAEKATGDLLNFRGADVLFSNGEEQMALNHARSNHCFAGFSHRLDVKLPNTEPLAIDIAQKYLGVGVSFYIRAELFNIIGPWRKFGGYGHEDIDYAYRCRAALGYLPHERALPIALQHIHHSQSTGEHLKANKDAINATDYTVIEPLEVVCS